MRMMVGDFNPNHGDDGRFIEGSGGGTGSKANSLPVPRDLWASGSFEGYDFYAKVYKEPSGYGLEGGCVSKIQLRKNNKILFDYDRGTISGNKSLRAVAVRIANHYDKGKTRVPEEERWEE